ncbi:hypothetical protein [Ralstonia pseudosolanacearum]|uniref:hypothetical protein n=1 Tax=Ralstonia pseudosolanacearum TaxID=1310165 RepID=UPI003CE6F712
MKITYRLLPVTSILALLAVSPLGAQDTEHLCQEQAASAYIHIAICSDKMPDEQMAAEGRRICAADLPCGTWFWLSAQDAPSEAPENHDGLTQAQVTSSLGVWVAEQEMFITIEPVQN